jgi:hypothetical protein
LGDNIHTVNKNTEITFYSSKDVGLEVNAEKTKHLLLFRDQNAGQNRHISIANRQFENVAEFKHLETKQQINKSTFDSGGN